VVDITSGPNTLNIGGQLVMKSAIVEIREVDPRPPIDTLPDPKGFCVIIMANEKRHLLSINGELNTVKIDSVDGTTPTGNSHLYELLTGLLV